MELYSETRINLQAFAEGAGGDGGTSSGEATGTVAQGVNSDPANAENGAQTADAQNTESPDLNAEFDALIKGKFKEQYKSRVQDTVQKRLKSTKDTVSRYESAVPILDRLSRKYGVKDGDYEALAKAVEDDDSLYEAEALERGLTVEQMKQISKTESENALLRRKMAEAETERRASEIYNGWLDQAKKTKAIYPTFDLDEELKNDDFAELLKNNVNVRTAFEVIHKDDIIGGAMQYAAKTVESKIANKIAANGKRPSENGVNPRSASVVKSDVSKMTRAQIEELNQRAMRGEKIIL